MGSQFNRTPPVDRYDQVKRRNIPNSSFRSACVVKCVKFPISSFIADYQDHESTGSYLSLVHPDPNDPKQDKVNLENNARRDFEITDRRFFLGAWVQRNGEVGRVQNLSVKADLQIVGSEIIVEDVPFERLGPVEEFPEGSRIIYNGWFGTVIRVLRMVTIQIGPDNEEDPYVGEIDYRDCSELFESPYWRKYKVYPKQKLWGAWLSLREATWELVKKGKKGKVEEYFEGRVKKVVVQGIDVEWNYRGFSDLPMPETRLKSDTFPDIVGVGMKDHVYFGVGNIRMLEPKSEDNFMDLSNWLKYRKGPCLSMQNRAMEGILGTEVSVQCMETRTMVNVLWKDGSSETLKSTELERYEATCVDFIRGDIVVRQDDTEKMGVVHLALHKTGMVSVMWDGGQTPSFVPTSDIRLYTLHKGFPGNPIMLFQENEDDVVIHHGWIVECTPYASFIVQMKGGDIRECGIWENVYRFFDDGRHSKPPPIEPPSFTVPNPEESYTSQSETRIVPYSTVSPSCSGQPNCRFRYTATFAEHHALKSSRIDTKTVAFIRAVKDNINELKQDLPEGIHVIGYKDRMDLFSVLLVGTEKTPFEDAMFLFDICLPSDFPNAQVQFRYKKIANVRIIPKVVDEERKFTLSSVKDIKYSRNEFLTVLKTLVELRGCLFTKLPFMTAISGTKQLNIRTNLMANDPLRTEALSRRYNERMITEMVLATDKLFSMLNEFPEWSEILPVLLKSHVPRMIQRIEKWMNTKSSDGIEFPLQVLSDDFVKNMKLHLAGLKRKLEALP